MQFFLFFLSFYFCLESTVLQYCFQLQANPDEIKELQVPQTRKRKRRPPTLAPRKVKKTKNIIAERTRAQLRKTDEEASLFNTTSNPATPLSSSSRSLSSSNEASSSSSSSSSRPKKEPVEDKRKKHLYTPHSTTFLTPFNSNVIATLKNIFERKTEGTIYVNSFFFTNPDLAYALADLKIKHPKIDIVVLIDNLSRFHVKKILPILFDAKIPVYLFPSTESELNHCKFIAWTYKSERGRKIYRVISGSANLTLLGMEQNANFEHMVIQNITKHEFKQFASITTTAILRSELLNKKKVKRYFLNEHFSPLKPNPKKETPQKKAHFYFSPVDSIEKIIIDRINNTSENGTISIVTYAFDLPPITHALLDALEKGVTVELIIDQYGLRRKNSQTSTPAQLQKLQEAGADVQIYKDQGIKKNHGKLILIEDGERVICCQGSFNLTQTSKDSFNQFQILGPVDSKIILENFINIIRPHLLNKSRNYNPLQNYNSASKGLFQD